MRRNLLVVRFLVGPALALSMACGKPSADDHMKKAEEYLAKSDLPAATLEMRSALQADGNRGDVRLKLGDAYLQAQDVAGALREYVRAADLLPGDVQAQLKAGRLLLRAGRFEDAKARADKALALAPDNTDAQILKGGTLAGLKDVDGALVQFQNALALDPTQDVAALSIGSIQFSRGQKTEAEATFRKAVDSAPKSMNARLALANFLWVSNERAETEQVLKDALTVEPASLPVNRALGALYLATGRAAEAEVFFQTIAKASPTTDAQMGLADYYLITQKPAEARKLLTDLAATKDAYVVATTRLAAIDAGEGARAQAMEKLQQVLDRFPKTASARLLYARVLLADGRRDDGLKQAVQLTVDRPDAPEATDAYFLVGTINGTLDRASEAEAAFKEVLKRQPRAVAAKLALASLRLQAGAVDEAERLAQESLTDVPGQPLARAILVRIALVKGDAAKARTDLAALRKDYPNAPEVLNLEAAQARVSGQPQVARAAYLKALAASPGNIEALTGLTSLDVATGRTKEAVTRLEDVLKTAPPTSGALIIAARAHAADKNWPRAEELLLKSIEADPSRLTAYGLLAQVYLAQNRLQDAVDRYRTLLEKNPKSVGVSTVVGILLEALKKTDEAEKQYKATLALDSNAAVAANNLAWMYVASNRNLDEAQALAQTANRALPDDPRVSDTLGWIYYRKKMASEAIRHLEHSVSRDTSDPSVFYHLGMAYALDFQPEKAIKALEKALSSKVPFEGTDEARAKLAQLK